MSSYTVMPPMAGKKKMVQAPASIQSMKRAAPDPVKLFAGAKPKQMMAKK